MSKKDFLKKLKGKLKALPSFERDRTIAYYDELIEDRKEAGATEEAAVYAMGDIDNIAAEILSDAKERGVLLEKSSGAGRTVLAVLLGIILICALIVLGALIIRKYACSGSPKIEWSEVNEEYSLGSKERIEINMENCDLFIKPSKDGDFHLTYYTNDDLVEFRVNETAECLSIEQRDVSEVYGIFFGCVPDRMKRTTILLVPEGFDGSIVSETAAGKTDIQGIERVSTLELSTTTGGMSVQDVKAVNASFTVTTGGLVIHSSSFENSLAANGTTGSIRLYAADANDITAQSTTGAIMLEEVDAGTVDVSLTTGGIDIKAVSADRLKAHSTTGGIKLNMVNSNDIDVSATTGSIKGQLPGPMSDYTIESSTSTGGNNLPQTQISGSRKLSVRTTTGSIKITFGSDE